jgi:outer membrane beta-barrel protein
MTNTRQNRFSLFVSTATALVVTALPLAAQAQRQSPLADAPAIRKRVELRDTRFELGPGFTTTVGQDFYHTMFIGGKLAFHLNDWLSLSATGAYGLANVQTAFGERLTGSLTEMPPVVREPKASEAKASMEKIKAAIAAQLEFTPFTGKFSLFGKVFAHYDAYLFGGAGALSVAPGGTAPDCTSGGTMSYCGVSGLRPGPTFGVGGHAFIKQWLAINFEARDIVARLNPSGRDVNGDLVATTADIGWASTFMFSTNIMFYLPSAAAISP